MEMTTSSLSRDFVWTYLTEELNRIRASVRVMETKTPGTNTYLKIVDELNDFQYGFFKKYNTPTIDSKVYESLKMFVSDLDDLLIKMRNECNHIQSEE